MVKPFVIAREFYDKDIFVCEEAPGLTRKENKVEKMMFKRESVDIMRTQNFLNRNVFELKIKNLKK